MEDLSDFLWHFLGSSLLLSFAFSALFHCTPFGEEVLLLHQEAGKLPGTSSHSSSASKGSAKGRGNRKKYFFGGC